MIFYYLLILSLPLVSHPLLEHEIGGVTVEKYLGAICFVAALAYVPFRQKFPRFFTTTQTKIFVVLYALLGISFVTKGHSGTPVDVLLIYTSHFVFLITTIILVDSLQRLRWVSIFAIASLGLVALYVLREWQTGSSAYGSAYRPGYVAGDPNFYTASAVLLLPIAANLVRMKGAAWQRVLSLGCLLLGLAASMLAASRGGFVGLLGAALVYIAQFRNRVRNFIVVSFILALFLIFSPSSALTRFLSPTGAETGAEQARLTLWRTGLQMVRSHPIGGVGVGTFAEQLPIYNPDIDISYMAHNTYLEMAAENGIPALLVFVSLIVATLFSLRSTRKLTRECGPQFVYELAGAFQAGLVGFAISCFFLSASFLKPFWFAIFISACLPAIARRSTAGFDGEILNSLNEQVETAGAERPKHADESLAGVS